MAPSIPPGAVPAKPPLDSKKWYWLDKKNNNAPYVVPPGTPGAVPGDQLNQQLLKNTVGSSKVGIDIPTPGVFGQISDAIQGVTDFFKLVGWLFHPRNILRAVEFLAGITLVIFGFWAALQARGERLEGFSTSESALSRSGLGRVSRQLAKGAPHSERLEAPHATKRKAAARGRRAAAHGKSRKRQTAKKIAKVVPK